MSLSEGFENTWDSEWASDWAAIEEVCEAIEILRGAFKKIETPNRHKIHQRQILKNLELYLISLTRLIEEKYRNP